MKNLRLIILTALCLLTAIETVGQIKRTQLEGDWQTNNQDSLYYKTDSLEFHSDINHWNSRICNIVSWRTEKGEFKFINTYRCTEPDREESSIKKEKLILKKRDYGQVIQLKRSKQIIEQFKIIDLVESRVKQYPYDIKKLSVLRFDRIEEQKLYNYIDSLVLKVLNYKSDDYGVTITDNPSPTRISIRDYSPLKSEPLLILNGIPIPDYQMLKKILFVEIISVSYLKQNQSLALYGARAANGVIILQVSNSKFKKVWKEYYG